MMIGTKFGQDGKFSFALQDLREKAPPSLVYCIAAEGHIHAIQDGAGGRRQMKQTYETMRKVVKKE